MSDTAYPLHCQAAPSAPDLLPRQPKSVRETGLELALIVELLAKAMFNAGKSSLGVLTGRLRLPINVLHEALACMVAEQLAEVAWRGESDVDLQYQLTGAGRQRACAWLERCAYAGAAPVTLDAYRAMVGRQSWRGPEGQRVGLDDIAAVFADDHLEAHVLGVLGAAMHSGRSLLLYGPPGGGKSTLARKLGRLLQGVVAVPHALLVGQEIIALYDPALHLAPTPPYAYQARQVLERRGSDLRWVLCQRPLVQVGAELSEDMLDLRFDPVKGCYHAPPHLQANHGLFIVDDLGRQRMAAPALLNRFMQPLEQRVDRLALRGGHQFSVPFEALPVFVTNCAPPALLDDAFLRRIGYQVHVGPLSAAAYARLVRQQCRALQIGCDEAALRYLLDELHGAGGRALLAGYPAELLGRIVDFAGCAGQPPCLTQSALEQAWHSMFGGYGPAPFGIDLCEAMQ